MFQDRAVLKNCPVSGFADEISPALDRQIAILQSLGMEWIEFRSAEGKNVADYTAEEAKALWERLEEAGIRLSAVGSPIGKIEITEDFEPHFEKFRHVAELAKIWETPRIRLFSFFIPRGERPEKYRDEVLRRTGRMVEYAARCGLVLLHENEKDIYGDNAARCLDLMREFHGDAYGCTFDFANFVQCGQGTMEAYEMLSPYIDYIHIKDAVAGTGQVVPAGQGDGNVRRILRELDQKGYDGFLSLEPHLTDFDGLAGLEKNAEHRGRSDTEAAFVTAARALDGLLGESE
ncbi:MAG: sugar phosphate isomerase/epimerase family protein [Eubacteriales bacterium]|nr:sugar phosphate isomerase/epimerase family protein [Eubacteriales bacterium]